MVNLTRPKQEIIHNHPLFSSLLPAELNQLANLFIIKEFAAGDIIVLENELLDFIYLIVEGAAEVRHSILSGDKVDIVPVAILNPGDAIGLSDNGLYSSSGQRTATVVAQTRLILLSIDLINFHQFLQENPHVNTMMLNSTGLVQRMNFIKKAAPFAKLNKEKLITLANHIEERHFAAGENIFVKGDNGDCCYIIVKGEVSVYTQQDDGVKKHIANLTTSMVLGEAALLSSLPRNASASALQDCRLLVLDRNLLQQVLEEATDAAASLASLYLERKRPLRLNHIETHIIKTNEQETKVILKDPQLRNYTQLSEQELFLWQLLDGQHSFRELTLAFNDRFKIFNPRIIALFVTKMEHAGFIEKITDVRPVTNKDLPWWLKIWEKVSAYMNKTLDITNRVNNVVSVSFKLGVNYLYTYIVQLIIALITVVGIYYFVDKFYHYLALFKASDAATQIFFAALITYAFIRILREFIKAYTIKACAREIASFTLGWRWLIPTASCDTSDMWLSTNTQRFLVELSGLYFELFVLGIASIASLFIASVNLTVWLWLVCCCLVFSIFIKFSPSRNDEGYNLFSILIDKQDLHASALAWLVEKAKYTWHNPIILWRHYRKEVCYWISCIGYLVAETILAFQISQLLFYVFIGESMYGYSILVAVAVFSWSILNYFLAIKKAKARLKVHLANDKS